MDVAKVIRKHAGYSTIHLRDGATCLYRLSAIVILLRWHTPQATDGHSTALHVDIPRLNDPRLIVR